MEKKLRMTPDQVFEQARLAVRFARNLCDDVEFSPEDGYRSDPDFLCRVLEAVIAEGATTINIPDTVGYAVPELYGEFIRDLRERIPNSDKAIWSVHCHNDLGMAVANSLAGVKIGGARQVECTINGLGERAGNCSLEEVVMAVRTRATTSGWTWASTPRRSCRPRAWSARPPASWCSPTRPWSAPTPLRTPAASTRTACSRRATPTRSCAPRTWAGRQQDRAGQAQRPQRLQAAPAGTGHRDGSEAEINAAFARFKDLADRKSEIFDEDILALVSDESVTAEQEHYRLLALSQRPRPASGRMPRGLRGRRPGIHAEATATARWTPA
jgi:2-isopropylmalate synthase